MDLVTKFVVFVALFTDDMALEAMECINGEDQDEWMYNKECDNLEFWQLIV